MHVGNQLSHSYAPPSRLDLGLLRQQWNTLRRLVVFLYHQLCFAIALNLPPKLLKKVRKKWQVRQLHREFLRAGSDVMQVTKDYRQSKSGKMEMSPDILFACECVHCAYLHCIVNVFRAWICSSKGIYSPKGVYQEILSLGQYFPIHSLGSRECIEKYALIQYRPC